MDIPDFLKNIPNLQNNIIDNYIINNKCKMEK